MIATLSFLLMKISVTTISFYWCSDTPNFVTWRSSFQNHFVPEIVSPLSCSSGLVRHTLPFVYFLKLISSIGYPDKCHISVFNSDFKSNILLYIEKFNYLPNKKNLELPLNESICWRKNKCDSKTEICFGKGRKNCGEKEKMLVTSIFSFTHNAFKRLLSQGR